MAENPRMKRLWANFASVWSLITRIPLPGFLTPAEFVLPSADAIVALSLAGALLGLLSVLPARAAAFLIPYEGAAWLATGIYTILGWSLHLDGWGDVWDGIGSGRRGEALRSVLKDSRTGAFGVAGIVLAIGTRSALLAGIEPSRWIASCAVACGTGRFGANVAMYLGEYPWEAGMGRDVVRNFNDGHLLRALAVTALTFPVWPGGWMAGILASSIVGVIFAHWGAKNLGGVNGDVTGAASVLGEILSLAVCSALVRI